ncbi:DUF4383 domain-containing protein [Candidatus Woesearchaeota archaeon]|nr:DUF4383 domain-containing protein [Candidatus Woesearchaeota archaeon]
MRSQTLTQVILMEAVKSYATITGWILLVLGVVGFLWGGVPGFLEFDTVHNVVHLLLGAILLWVAYGADEEMGVSVVKVLSVVYILLAVLGFALGGMGSADVWGLLQLELGENLVHLVLGIWGAWAAWSA